MGLLFSETGVAVLDELESDPGPPLDLILSLIVRVVLLRACSGGVSLLVIEGVGVTLLILRLAT